MRVAQRQVEIGRESLDLLADVRALARAELVPLVLRERLVVAACVLHPAAHVCLGSSWPTLVHDGASWLMFFDW